MDCIRFFLRRGLRVLLLAALADHRGKNGNALFTTFHAAAKLVPRPYARHMRGLGPLSRYEEDIAEGIRVEIRHCIQVSGERFTVSRFQLLDEILHVFADELLCGGWLPVFTAGSRIDGG